MPRFLVLLSAVILQTCLQCSTEPKVALETVSVIDNPLVLDFKFGADENKLPSAYILARAGWTPGIDDEGNIFISDESMIKVYDNKGNPKMILGGPGEGPGEFPSQVTYAIIGPNGYLTISENVGFTLFSPDYQFIKNVRVRNNPKYTGIRDAQEWNSISIGPVISFDEDTRVYEVNVNGNRGSALMYETEEFSEVICYYDRTKSFTMGRTTVSIVTKGEFLWTLPDDRKVVYCHPDYDLINENGKSVFKLLVFNFENLTKTQFEFPYTPVVIPESVKEDEKRKYDNPMFNEGKDRLFEIIDDSHYYPPIQKLYSDQNLVFAVTYVSNEKNEFLTEVIDLDTGDRLRSFYLPKFSQKISESYSLDLFPEVIKNGYAYRQIHAFGDNFAEMEVYKIDPAVYGK